MKRLLFLTLLCMGIAIFLAGPVCAKVTGPCADCHTMHNSQGGLDEVTGGPYRHLTKGDCIGCHTGTNTSTGTTPFVLGDVAPTYTEPGVTGNTLAGGNFWWVNTIGDTKGHNVDPDNPDSLSEAPGREVGGTCSGSCHYTLAAVQTNIPEFGSNCEGCHLAVKHHANDHPGGDYNVIVDETGGWFRFLAGHSGTNELSGFGVEGIEEQYWQFVENDTENHNEYLGREIDHTGNYGGFGNIDANTMTAYCTGCHGGFHDQDDTGNVWIRHPSDAVLPGSGTEYASYTTYNPQAPVARPSLIGYTSPASRATVVPGTDFVMCLSCHRAHGSPYDDMLRWNYDGTEAGGGGDDIGCFTCHTTKND